MPRRALTTCTTTGCPAIVDQPGKCDTCKQDAERQRGSARARGYDTEHERRFRRSVLTRDVVCVICRKALAVVADHYPRSRRELIDDGADPDDPRYGRGLCKPCDSAQTAERQPGGWNNPG